MVLMVLNRKWGLIWLWSALSSMDVASFFWSLNFQAAIWEESRSANPLAMLCWVAVTLRAWG